MESHNEADVHGADPDLNPNMAPTADPKRIGGSHLDLHIVTEYYRAEGSFRGMRMSLEFAMPVYESHDSTQLESDWTVAGAIQWTF